MLHRLYIIISKSKKANLTLMALGSSAPEIILNVIEIIGSGFIAGDLGPGISAIFNILSPTPILNELKPVF